MFTYEELVMIDELTSRASLKGAEAIAVAGLKAKVALNLEAMEKERKNAQKESDEN